jgi:hypothetical protein
VSAESTSYQRLREHLAYLKLTTAAEQLKGRYPLRPSRTPLPAVGATSRRIGTRGIRRIQGTMRPTQRVPAIAQPLALGLLRVRAIRAPLQVTESHLHDLARPDTVAAECCSGSAPSKWEGSARSAPAT